MRHELKYKFTALVLSLAIAFQFVPYTRSFIGFLRQDVSGRSYHGSGGSVAANCTGVATGASTDSGDNNLALGVDCTPASNMTVTGCVIKITTTASGNGSCAIYATMAHRPVGDPIATSSSTALTTTTTTIPISASLTAGTEYVVVINLSSASTVIGINPTGCVTDGRWSNTVGATFPNFPQSGDSAGWNDTSVCPDVHLEGTTA